MKAIEIEKEMVTCQKYAIEVSWLDDQDETTMVKTYHYEVGNSPYPCPFLGYEIRYIRAVNDEIVISINAPLSDAEDL